MIIRSIRRTLNFSADPVASDVGRFLARRESLSLCERAEPAPQTRAQSLEELYPSLFEEPRLLMPLERAASAGFDALMRAIVVLRRRISRRRQARGGGAR